MELTKFPEIAQQAITDAIEELIQAFDPEYILLGGSFGKGDWLEEDDGNLLSDIEIIFINDKHWNRKKSKNIALYLTRKYQFDFSLSGYSKKRVLYKQPGNLSFGNPGYITLTYFDTIRNKNIIYKKFNTPLLLPSTSINEVPLWEVWRLYINRLGDYLYEYFNDNKNEIQQVFYLFKIIQSAADTLLISLKLYSPDIKTRYKNILKIYSNPENYDLSDAPTIYIRILEIVLATRKNHSLKIFRSQLSRIKDIQNEIIIFWLNRLEKEMTTQPTRNYTQFFLYKENSIIYSNVIKLIITKNLWNIKFKIFKLNINWRQIVLLSVSSLYKEVVSNKIEYNETFKIINKIVCLQQTNHEIVKNVICYWKLLR